MLTLLVVTAMAVLLAGCSSGQGEAQDSSQGGEQEVGSSQQTSEPSEQGGSSSQQTSELTTDETAVDSCAENGGISGQQEEASGGEVSNGKIAFTRLTDANDDIYVIDGEGAHETRLTHTPRLSEQNPVWSPDGQKIAFTTSLADSSLYVMNADGTNKTQLAAHVSWSPSWSPDGGKIAFRCSSSHGAEGTDLCVTNADGTETKLIARDTSYLIGATVWVSWGRE